MNTYGHRLYLSSPDSTCSKSSSSSTPMLLNQKQSTRVKSFLISDILKRNFGHQNEKCNFSLSSSTSNDLISSLNINFKSEMLPAWVYCTRYSSRPSAGTEISLGSLTKQNQNEKYNYFRSGHQKTQIIRFNRL